VFVDGVVAGSAGTVYRARGIPEELNVEVVG
jgi:hypothetical protein